MIQAYIMIKLMLNCLGLGFRFMNHKQKLIEGIEKLNEASNMKIFPFDKKLTQGSRRDVLMMHAHHQKKKDHIPYCPTFLLKN